MICFVRPPPPPRTPTPPPLRRITYLVRCKVQEVTETPLPPTPCLTPKKKKRKPPCPKKHPPTHPPPPPSHIFLCLSFQSPGSVSPPSHSTPPSHSLFFSRTATATSNHPRRRRVLIAFFVDASERERERERERGEGVEEVSAGRVGCSSAWSGIDNKGDKDRGVGG